MTQLTESFFKHIAQTSPEPIGITVERAEGVYLHGPNGERWIDFISGICVSNIGHGAKEVLEAITAKSIDVLLEEEVLSPLQLKDMHFKGNDVITQFGAHGHKQYIPSDIRLLDRTMVAFSLQTTSEALAKFAIALHQRKGLKRSTYKEMFKIHSKRSDGTQWGLGVRIEETDAGLSYGHSGSTGRGFIGNLVFYDDSGLGYAVLTNSQMGGWLSLPLLNEFLITGKLE